MEQNQNLQQYQYLQKQNEIILMYTVEKVKRMKNDQIIFTIFPFKQNFEIIKINNQSLKIQINHLIIQTNNQIQTGGFKLVLHPLSGLYFIQTRFFYNSNLVQFKQLTQNIKQKYQKSKKLKQFNTKILNLIKNGTSFHNHKQIKLNLQRYCQNSSSYAWNSWSNHSNQKIIKSMKSKQKLQIWSDQQQDQLSTLSQNLSNPQSNKSIFQKGNSDIYEDINNIEQYQTLFYIKSRCQYDKFNPLPGRSKQIDSDFELQESYLNRIKKFFISKQQDKKLFISYLKPYQVLYRSIIKKKQQQIQANKEDSFNTPKKKAAKIIDKYIKSPNSIVSSLLKQFSYQQGNSQSNSQNQKQEKTCINLLAFLQSNSISITKKTKWKIIKNYFQIIHKEKAVKQTKSEDIKLQTTGLRISKGYRLKQMFKKTDIYSNFYSNKQKLLLSGSSSGSKRSYHMFDDFQQPEETYEEKQKQQKKLSLILTSFVCWMLFPKRYFSKKNVQPCFKKYENNNFPNIENWIIGSQQKFYQTNLELQSFFIYLYQKSKTVEKKPFSDWTLIVFNYFSQNLQQNKALLIK